MSTSESFEALRRANPRTNVGFAHLVETAAEAVRAHAVTTLPRVRARGQRRQLMRVSAVAASLAIAAAAAVFLMLGSFGGSPSVESAAAAVTKAAAQTAVSADGSGVAVVRITHERKLWAAARIRWHGADLGVSQEAPRRRHRAGTELRVVDGMMYGVEDGGWVVLGPPSSIDPGSGTTPADYLAAVRQDAGGVTLRRITGGMTGLKTTQLGDGSTVYEGAVAAGLIARETGFKEGHSIRELPFGYVAHDEAADPAARLDAAVTVSSDGIVRIVTVTWGAWRYSVTYSGLGATAGPVAPKNARPLRRR